MTKIRIIQWRECGDDDDTMTARIVEDADETPDHDFLCDLHDLDPELDFDEGGITIIDTWEICDDTVFEGCDGKKLKVNFSPA